MDDFTVDDAVVKSLIVEKVKHVLDSWRQDIASTCDSKQGLEQVVNIHLQRALQTTI